MFPAQLAVSAVVWAAVVWRLYRLREALIGRAEAASRSRRLAFAAIALCSSVVILALGMLALTHGGLSPTGLSWWGWPLITLAGAAFVVLQTVALVPLVLNAVQPVTHGKDGSSDRMDINRP